jgi:acetolactate synthase-1/2/3 large subunit
MSAGMVPEDHPLSFQAARSTAFREADCIVVVGTRDNYILNYLQPPVVSRDSTVVQLNANPEDLSHNRLADVGILADAKLGLAQLSTEIVRRGARPSRTGWTARLDELNAAARERAWREGRSSAEGGVHPYQLARILRQMSPRDAVMVLDGRETLAFGRRAVESYVPAGLLNPGTYGTMGVGVPYALGAKLAVGRRPVVALLGDGAFGYHALELDTAVRHKIGFVCVVANNGGWTGARHRPGHALEYSPYHNLSTVFGCWGASVACEQELEPVLKEAFDYVKAESKPAVVNVITSSARASSRPRDFRLNAAKNEYAET